MKKKNDGYKKIKSLFYIVAIISMIIAIVGKVRAESFEEGFYTEYFLHDANYYNVDLSSYTSYLDIIKEQTEGAIRMEDSNNVYYFFFRLPDYAGLYMYGLSYSGGGFRMTNYSSTYNPCIRPGTTRKYYSNLSYNYVCAFRVVLGKNERLSMNYFYIQNDTISASMERTIHYIPQGTSGSLACSVLSSISENCYKVTIVDNANNQANNEYFYSNYDNWLNDGIVVYGNLLVMSRYNDSYPAIIEQNYVYTPPYDSNFIIYKSYGVGGINDPLLNIQYADDIFSQGYTYTTLTTYNLTFDVDGTETTVAISSSVYPDDFFENGSFRTSFDLIYRMLSNKIVNF